MLKTDITEIKRRLKVDKCLPSKVSGCCVGADKEILATFHTHFGFLEEGDRIKYLEIASKVLSGKMGNNALELTFPYAEEQEGGRQSALLALRDCDFEDEELKSDFFKKVIDSYQTDKEYVIFMFHDTYDVMDKTTDGIKLDESSTVYNYIIVAVCPLQEAEPGLIYSHTEQVIRERIRDWVVTEPEIGFVFPAFTERAVDIHAVLYHIKSSDNTQEEFVNSVLGCEMVQTNDDKKEVFGDIITEALNDEANVGRLVYDINESLRDMVEIKREVSDPETGEITGTRIEREHVEVSDSVLKAVLEDNEVAPEKIEAIQKAVSEEIKGTTSVDQIIDRKLLEKEKFTRREEELLQEIAELKEENIELRKQLQSLKENR